MESNQKLMILSLLNLYTSYVNLKSTSTEIPNKKQNNNTFCNRSGTKRFQTNKSLNTQLQSSAKNVPVATKVSTGIQKVQEKTNDRRESTAHYASLEYPISSGTITFLTDENGESLADKTETTTHYASSKYPTSSGTVTVMTDDKEESVTECYIDSEQNIVIDPALIANISNNYTIIADATDSAAVTENSKPVKRRRRGKKKTDDGKRLPRVRRWRTRPINIDRALTGYHRKVFSTIKQMDNQKFFEHTRMSKSLFDWLLTFVQSSLRKKRQTIYPEERLAITLNYLAFGTPLQSIAFKHKVGKSTARQIVLDTCSVLWDLLSPIYLSEPTTSQYAEIAKYIKNKWDIPNCVGAADGRHASIRDPSKTAPNNNKITINIPIYAICDTKYKFLAASVGNLDKSNDGIFQLSPQNNVIISDNLPLPLNKFISPLSPSLPHYFISNTSFPLRKNIMCPYAETNLEAKENVFNYKMSCVSSFIDNTFGVLTARFRVLLTTIEFLPENCKTVILACIALHNFIMANDDEQLYCPADFVDRESAIGIVEEGEWRNELKNNGDEPLPSIISNERRATIEAKNMRNTLANLFESEIITFDIKFS